MGYPRFIRGYTRIDMDYTRVKMGYTRVEMDYISVRASSIFYVGHNPLGLTIAQARSMVEARAPKH